MKKLFLLVAVALLAFIQASAQSIRGDIDGNGKVNTADIVALYNIIINGGTDANADLDSNGKITTADVVTLYNIILNGSSSLVLPEETTITVNSVSFKMILVEGGTYQMGATSEQFDDSYLDERPAHQVTLSPYYIAQTEVTQELWQALMGQKPTASGSQWTAEKGLGPQYPAYYLNHDNTLEFIQALNQLTGLSFRLPTEAEWEFAARGGSKSKGYKFAGSDNLDEVAWYYDNASNQTHEVAAKLPNELGLYDMTGNVSEWCSDWKGDYSNLAQTNPTGPETGYYRITRGGCWYSSTRLSRLSCRFGNKPEYNSNGTGLRLAFGPESIKPVEPEESPKTFTVNGVSFKMIPVQAGTFQMGGTQEQGKEAEIDEQPVHQVTLSKYYLAQTEVTQELWQAVMCSNPSTFKNPKNPVETVSWEECQVFVERLRQLTGQNFRLPTEAEWEFAARGGNKSKSYKYAGSDNLDDVAWYSTNTSSQPNEVAAKLPNELGLYDMSGNVSEWCNDWYGSYSSAAQTDPTGPETGSYHITRGGSWDNSAAYCRLSKRRVAVASSYNNFLGLRLALGTEPAQSVDSYSSPKIFTLSGVSIKMIPVAAGSFQMGATAEQGSDALSDEQPVHQVTLSSYYIAQTEVTQELWQAVMKDEMNEDIDLWSSGVGLGPKYPAYNVSYEDCQTFIQKLNKLTGQNFRLPTEAEWEFAARGGNKSKGYKYSGSNKLDDVAWYDSNSSDKSHPVATKQPNELGLYDMSGNLEEWCDSESYSYSKYHETNPQLSSPDEIRSLRGGSWDGQATESRVSARSSRHISNYYVNLGLRLAL